MGRRTEEGCKGKREQVEGMQVMRTAGNERGRD
jgi:hypothetical protein